MRFRDLLLALFLSSCLATLRPETPPPHTVALDGVELGMTRAQVAQRLGGTLDREAAMFWYDLPICSTCMQRDCSRVDFSVHWGPMLVLYNQDGVFQVTGRHLRFADGRRLEVGNSWKGLGEPESRHGQTLVYPQVLVTVQGDRVAGLTLYRRWVCREKECGWTPGWWER